MIPKEPINLLEWRTRTATLHRGRLFTCGRPGRATYGKARRTVDNETIDLWVRGLPEAEILHIVSLLGKKKDGYSEFGYYPFRSSTEIDERPTFQEWLDERFGRRFDVHEFPTTDARGIPADVLKTVTSCVIGLIESSNTVVVIDSAGSERTKKVCSAIGSKRIP